jgi:mannose-6-phosphate isomerase-like protein (cupin superfamily)
MEVAVTTEQELRKHTPFERWVLEQNLKVVQQQVIPDVRAVELEPWERTGCTAALIDLTPYPVEEGDLLANLGTSRYLLDIPAGGTFNAERHMYEEIFFVISGRGATTVWYPGSPKHTFEWQEGSVFSIPLNAWHEIYNGSGDMPARLYAAFTAPTVFNLYDSSDFVFNCEHTFPERFDPEDEAYFSGKATKIRSRLVRTNFVSNVRSMGLDRWSARGPGTNMHALMANGYYVCHLSEFPGLSYKKAHTATNNRTRAGLNSEVAYLFLSGQGYDLQWDPGVAPGPGVPFERIDYGTWSLLTPGNGFHQHFNVSDEAIRYVVLRRGNPELLGGNNPMNPQIEFQDEDPAVWELFESELKARGHDTSFMDTYRSEEPE